MEPLRMHANPLELIHSHLLARLFDEAHTILHNQILQDIFQRLLDQGMHVQHYSGYIYDGSQKLLKIPIKPGHEILMIHLDSLTTISFPKDTITISIPLLEMQSHTYRCNLENEDIAKPVEIKKLIEKISHQLVHQLQNIITAVVPPNYAHVNICTVDKFNTTKIKLEPNANTDIKDIYVGTTLFVGAYAY